MCQKRFTFITYYVCSKYDGSHKVRYNLLHQYLQIVSYVPGTGDTIMNRQQTSEGSLILTEIIAYRGIQTLNKQAREKNHKYTQHNTCKIINRLIWRSKQIQKVKKRIPKKKKRVPRQKRCLN